MTEIIKSIDHWRELRKQIGLKNQTLGFVPTMGNLHLGHQSLLARSVKENQITVLSLFVNPTQFDNATDLQKYPRTLEQDLKIAEEEGVDFLLLPNYEELYPDSYRYRICENELSQKLCGKYRPGHFDGMLTVVQKLFNWVKPSKAYFGEKDYQQLELIKGMVKAFFMEVEIIACQTVRDINGLALSSRNSRLTAEQYQQALQFPRFLQSQQSCEEVAQALVNLGFQVDYIEEHQGRRYGAVRVGEIRLIDNVIVNCAGSSSQG